jgi:hypothetical protein
MIKIIFKTSEDNDSDIFSKNTKTVLHEKHSEKMFWYMKEMNGQKKNKRIREIKDYERVQGIRFPQEGCWKA